MEKFGTGAAQAIWKWWNDFWERNVRDKGFVGMLAGIFPFIITIIGVIITGIIDIFVEFFDWFGGLFNSKDDDRARDTINSRSCAQLNALSNDQLISMINSMLSGPTGDDDENAMLKLFKCLPCERLHGIVNSVGLELIQDNFQGSEFDELQLILGNCSIISFSSWDDDATRLFVSRMNCGQINALSDSIIRDLINNMLSGFTGDDDENAILKLLGCLSCARKQTVVNLVGLGNLQSAIDGSEFDELQVMLGVCGIINFSSWDDDASRLFVGKINCAQINALSDSVIRDLINNMLSGFTGDDDENAILKLLGCLSCARKQTVVNLVGLGNLQSALDGSQFDDLQVMLGICGIINFSSWDDDATRVFVNHASCAQINALTAQNLHQLFRNLIEGSCGDDDENAINKIMQCTDCAKIHAVLAMSGTHWDDFDDAIQGSEWTAFKSIMNSRCGITG